MARPCGIAVGRAPLAAIGRGARVGAPRGAPCPPPVRRADATHAGYSALGGAGAARPARRGRSGAGGGAPPAGRAGPPPGAPPPPPPPRRSPPSLRPPPSLH